MSDIRTESIPAMKSELYDLCGGNLVPKAACEEENLRLKSNIEKLKQSLTNEQSRLLLRILDDKDLVCETTALQYYAQGFRKATRIMIECFYLE